MSIKTWLSKAGTVFASGTDTLSSDVLGAAKWLGRTAYKGRMGILGVSTIGSTFYNADKVRRKAMAFPEFSVKRPGGSAFGSGFITWSKGSGMPANHLSSNGIGLALSANRHSSII